MDDLCQKREYVIDLGKGNYIQSHFKTPCSDVSTFLYSRYLGKNGRARGRG